jgi:hypothetical protein
LFIAGIAVYAIVLDHVINKNKDIYNKKQMLGGEPT